MNSFSNRFRFARLAVALGCVAISARDAVAQEQPVKEDPVGTALIAGPNTFSSNQGPLPSLDAALAQAVENSPDVAAAKAKLALAEAELIGKRLEVSRQVLSSYSILNNFGAQAEALKAKLQAVTAMLDIEKQRVNAGMSADAQSEVIKRQAEIQELKAQLAQVAAQADGTGRELRMLLGSQRVSNDPRSPSSATSPGTTHRSQMPQGPVVEKVKSILDETTDMQFADNPTPLKDVADYIVSKHKVPIYFHPSLNGAAILINVNLKGVPLRYAMEAMQELAQGEISFVVRDYGILVVPKAVADDNGYVSAVDFGRDRTGAKTGGGPTSMFDPPRQGSTIGPSRDHDAPRPSTKAEASRN